MTPTAEFNFHCDPEAAHFVLDRMGGRINLVDLDVCGKSSFSWVCNTYSILYRFEIIYDRIRGLEYICVARRCGCSLYISNYNINI